ncbi:MAG: glycosyltransferase family A protein [Verrucomicrobia bacterium]|nr:glycosyltransferase family A protein [Verrucomicrobiota bacterium]
MTHCPRTKVDSYFERFGYCKRQIERPAHPELGTIVVIPCHDEPDLITCLNSLWECRRPSRAVEVIVVLNSSIDSSPEVMAQNRKTLADFSAWVENRIEPRFQSHVVHFPELPQKHAGVGLARKIGMDEAVRRLADVGRSNGIVACFDADCTCDPDYLAAIESCFQEHANAPGCSVYFEHPLDGPLDAEVYRAVATYELHLRYYVQALRYSGFPHAYHTVGSSMAVRAGAYRKQGGMNRRKAGEDFYFLQKIIPLGGFRDLTTTRVIPSPRPSRRVPFGTGKAVRDYLECKTCPTYPLEAFLDLKQLFAALSDLYRSKDSNTFLIQNSLPRSVSEFLKGSDFVVAADEILRNTASERAFLKRFFHWFNGFQAMKFIHFARDHFYGPGTAEADPASLLPQLFPVGASAPRAQTVKELLAVYRMLDRESEWPGNRPDTD